MTPPQSADFVKYIRSHLGINLGYHLDWTPIAKCIQSLPKMDWSDMAPVTNAIIRLESQRRNESKDMALQHKARYELFFGLLLDHLLKDITEQEGYHSIIPTLARALTRQGTEQVDPVLIKTVGPHYQLALSVAKHQNRRPYTSLLEGLMHVPQVWDYAKHAVMPTLKETLTQSFDIQDIEWRLLHRFEPHIMALNDYEQHSAYSDMCGRVENMHLEPYQLVHIFKGPHHNSAAWLEAMNAHMMNNHMLYTPDANYEMNESWSVLTQQMSTLPLDPLKRMDWKLWTSLCMYEYHYPVLSSTIESIQKRQPQMHEAFTTFWPLVTAMFDEHEDLYAKATQYYAARTAGVDDVSLHLDFGQM